MKKPAVSGGPFLTRLIAEICHHLFDTHLAAGGGGFVDRIEDFLHRE